MDAISPQCLLGYTDGGGGDYLPVTAETLFAKLQEAGVELITIYP